ncbi:fumarylacetoacetate hydrolase family protein [Thalassobacillus pellis]|uniref:fumarylacetoacetate hydrolase family protein n=1 Tax=Thalassobacillus pellis TaxID=748008 RepID=UPI0019612A63|nr:fumarylacetoacetate hydrolase family protein [Thalassobacillus pellis]MBM7551606.1 2-dehydro-3-deoxy-D-arabinonate dehydratase [Thalassobacillus pellis]
MRIIRYLNNEKVPVLAAVTNENEVYSLPYRDFMEMIRLAEEKNSTPLQLVEDVITQSIPHDVPYEDLKLLVPIKAQEVWASGVTYEKSRDGRNYESTDGKLDATTFYDKVYEAERPEIFFKSTDKRTVGPEEDVYLRSDSNWQIPEPEVGLVLSKKGEILGFTVGNDMSCRDIEGENPLYLPQAKVWKNSCAIGPAIRLTETVEDPYNLKIICRIYRNQEKQFEGSANTGQMKRRFEELVSYLLKDNTVFDGTVLLTGTCIVPPNEFTLQNGDKIEIEVPGIGKLVSNVKSQVSQPVY